MILTVKKNVITHFVKRGFDGYFLIIHSYQLTFFFLLQIILESDEHKCRKKHIIELKIKNVIVFGFICSSANFNLANSAIWY